MLQFVHVKIYVKMETLTFSNVFYLNCAFSLIIIKKQYNTLFPEKTILEIDVPKYILVNPHFLAINAIGLANQFRHRQISLGS